MNDIERDRSEYGDGTASYPGDPGRENETPSTPEQAVETLAAEVYRLTNQNERLAVEIERLCQVNAGQADELRQMRVRAGRVRRLCVGPRLQETAEILRALDTVR